ncbi:MAG: ABC transporter permease [Cyclobacteriaceae bacterium]|nr:ABC transporter permease [Cyclobacteriaceae bacterium]
MTQPPKLARKILEWFAAAAFVEDMLGDLDELYFIHLKTKSTAVAKLLYWRGAMSLLFSYALKKRKAKASLGLYSSSISMGLLRNYFKVAVRSLYQHKYFTILNAFGLAVGMSISLLLLSLISYVQTYDDFHTNRESIYTIISERTEGVEQLAWALAPHVLADKLSENSNVKAVVRINSYFREEVKLPQGLIPLRGYYVEPNFLDVFTYQVTQGNARATLSQPNHIVITESAALKIFNTTHVLGKTLELNTGGLVVVGAVMKDHPINSHFDFELLASFASLPQPQASISDQWTYFDFQYLYVLLEQTASVSDFQSYLDKISDDTYAKLPVKVAFQAQHLNDIALGPDLRMAIGPKWEASGMIVFAVIAAMILLPACFNYTNISIARALKRAKEIGLRKTLGGVKFQVFFQFITETVVVTFIAFIGALVLFYFMRTEFQKMLVASNALDLSLTVRMACYFLLFALGTGLVAGIFPALYFGGLNPIQALKNKVHKGSSAMRVRKVLTVFQFILSFGFILSLVVFNRQYQYSLNFNFGFAKENIVNVALQGTAPHLVKNEFSKLAPVQSVAMSSQVMGLGYYNTWIKDSENDSTEVAHMYVDDNYIPLFGLTLIAGTNFTAEAGLVEKFIIVNEAFVNEYKIATPVEAIGKTYNVEGSELQVIGVVKNFHFAPLRYPIKKFFFRNNPAKFTYAHLKVSTADAFTMFTDFETHWNNLNPEQKVAASFFEDDLNDGYNHYVVLLKIIGFLGLLALTISVLGLLGMVVYSAETKVKEISIRKVFGASVLNLNYMLSKEYLKLIVWAVGISAPVTAYLIYLVLPHLQYYSTTVSLWDVVISTAILLGLAMLTVWSQTNKVAMANPADTLRSE